jgi:lysophospholipase L1-like esterase
MSYESLAIAVDLLTASNNELTAAAESVRTASETARDRAQGFAVDVLTTLTETQDLTLQAQQAALDAADSALALATGVTTAEAAAVQAGSARDSAAVSAADTLAAKTAVQAVAVEVQQSADEVEETKNVIVPLVTTAQQSATEAGASAVLAAAAHDAILLNNNIKDTVAQGLAATVSGEYFSVPSAESAEYLILYKNDAGSALEIKRYPSQNAVANKLGTYSTSNNRVPLWVDSVKNVPVWLENGMLAATGLAQSFLDMVINAVGLKRVIPTNNSSNALVPLFVDSANNVPVWLENGLFAASGLSPSLISAILPNVTANINLAKSHSDSRTLYKYRANAAKLRTGSLSQVNVIITGDSWAELSPMSQAIADRLYALFGKSSDGWVSINTGTNTLNGITAVLVGLWNTYDASTGGLAGVAPDHGCGIDGRSMWTTATDARYIVNLVTSTEVEIFYQDLDGTFQYKASDSATWNTVVCGNTDTTMSVKLTGMADNTPRTIEVRTIGNTGTVRVHGLYFTRSAVSGAVLSKCGNSGAIAQNLAVYASQIGYYAAKMNPSLLGIILSTNDYRVGVTIADFKAHITTLVNAYRAAVPDMGIILIAPARTDGVATVPLVQFRDALSQLAVSLGCEFYSLYDEFGTWAQMNALGGFNDGFHPSNSGAALSAGRLATLFLNDR